MPSDYPVKVWQSWSCHPTKAHFFNNDVRDFLKSVATHPSVVAVGEAGLDYSRLPGELSGGWCKCLELVLDLSVVNPKAIEI